MENAQQLAEKNERRVVKFTNIDDERFTHSFRGISISVEAGHSYSCRYPEGDHLAMHLARKILSRKKKEEVKNDPRGGILYKEPEVNELKSKIIQEIGSDVQEKMTPEKARVEDLKKIDKKYPSKPDKDVTKADVIKSLEERGIKADINKSKDELLSQLMETEAKG